MFLPRKQLKSCVCSFTILSCSAFNSAFVTNDSSFLFKLESFVKPEMLDSQSNFFLSLYQLCIICQFILIRSLKIFFSQSTKPLTPGILLSKSPIFFSPNFVYLCCIELFESMQTHQEFYSLNYLLSIYFFVGALNKQLVYLLHDLIFFLSL